MTVDLLTAEELETLREGSAPYGGSWFAYAGQDSPESRTALDFETELTNARERERIRDRAKVRLAREADRLFWLREFPNAPTPEALRKHAEKFGKEGVQEVADLYGIDLQGRSKVRSPKRLSEARSKRATDVALAMLAGGSE
jgi:hypothetical protein